MLKLNVPSKNKHSIYLSLGSNIQPEENLPEAVELLAQRVHVISVSNAWKTPAVGSRGPDFLNAVAFIKTDLAPEVLKSDILQSIESKLGRVRTSDKNAPRTIDLDILIIDGFVIENEIWSQVYLAVPLAEIDGNFMQIESGRTILDIAQQLTKINPIHSQPHVFKIESYSDSEET